MPEAGDHARAAVGFTVKSGWASAVLLIGSATACRVVDSRIIELSDPALPESRQPYHASFGTARAPGPALSRLIAAVQRFGRKSVSGVIQDYRAMTFCLEGAGVIVGSLVDAATIANDHIRIHALEGQLFRGVVEEAVTRARLRCSIWRDRDLYGLAAITLKQPERALRDALTTLGRHVGGPWRAEQKAAALAAWLVIAASPSKTDRDGHEGPRTHQQGERSRQTRA